MNVIVYSIDKFLLRSVKLHQLQQEERECSYYLKTGQCKFGITCKFHHPDQPADVSAPAAARPFYPTVSSLPAPPEEYNSTSTSSRVARPQLVPGSYVPGTYGPVFLHPGVVTIQNWSTYSVMIEIFSQSIIGYDVNNNLMG